MNPTYTEVKWKRGSVFKADPAQALKEIEALNLKYNGFAPDGALVEHAKSKRSVLHHEFEWDDSIAGYKYRLQTEKKIKRSLVGGCSRVSGAAPSRRRRPATRR